MTDVMRIPLIKLYGNLIVSIQVAMTDSLVMLLKDDITASIEKHDISGLAIDVSGVDLMDSFLSRAIHDLVLIARLMGVKTVICGIEPTVAMTLVEMGLDLEGVNAVLNLEHAMDILGENTGRRRRTKPTAQNINFKCKI